MDVVVTLSCYNLPMASLVKDSRSPFYWARFRNSLGHEFTRSTRERGKERALEVAQAMESMARTGIAPEQTSEPEPPILRLVQVDSPSLEPPSITIELEDFLASSTALPEISLENKTLISTCFQNFLGPEVSALPLTSLSLSLLTGYWAFRLNAGITKELLNLELIFLRSLYQAAIEAGHLSENIAMEIPLEDEREISIKPFSLDQILALLRACIHFNHGDDWRGVLAISVATGRSLSEVANLRSKDLLTNKALPVLQFPQTDQTKKGIASYSLHPLLVEYLFLRNLSNDSARFLFPSLANKLPDAPNAPEQEFQELMAAAEIEQQIQVSSEHETSLIYEYSALSLEASLTTKEIDTVMNLAFRLRLSRPYRREFEQSEGLLPTQTGLQYQSAWEGIPNNRRVSTRAI